MAPPPPAPSRTGAGPLQPGFCCVSLHPWPRAPGAAPHPRSSNHSALHWDWGSGQREGRVGTGTQTLVLKSVCPPGKLSSTDRHAWFPRGGGLTNMRMEEQSKGACSGSPRFPGPPFPEAWLHWHFCCHDTLQPWNRLSVEPELDGGGWCDCKQNTE